MNLSRGGALTALTLVVAVGCGTSDASPPAADGGGVGVSPDGGEPLPPAPPEPVRGAPPPEGIFVSASKGLAGADGTMGRPVPTIAEAITIAIQKRMPINVCAETYNETVHLADGITMFGYYDCADLAKWTRVDKHAQILAPGPVVKGENLVLPAKLAGFDIEALDAAPAADGSPAASSIAMVIRSSRNLALSNVSIRSAKGQDGTHGVEPAPNQQLGAPKGYNGKRQEIINPCLVGNVFRCNQNYASGAMGGTSQCKVGANGGAGGEGGDGRSFNPDPRGGGAVYPGAPAIATATTAAGGTQVNGLGSQADGRDGDKGMGGNAGSNGAWTFDSSGFIPGDGSPGSIGGQGKGGGGGGGSPWYYCNSNWLACNPNSPSNFFEGASGSGGGAGGCGGTAGTPGRGGGASIGLLVIESEISILDSRIASGIGGAAGKGALGTVGTPGGAGGKSCALLDPAFECGGEGGNGGAGGDGGPSGHGDPGPSIPLVYKGNRPALATVDLVPGDAGAGQAAMTRGDKTVPAAVGKSLPEHSF